MNLLLAYPAGFQSWESLVGERGKVEAGNIHNIIRGAHLYCDTAAESPAELTTEGSVANDQAMIAGWMKGKCHPVTGETLRCERLELPPGSLICCNTHAPHRVGATTAAGLRPRLAMSLFICIKT